jgi:RNA polymerase sigma factor (sigma-70 family)
VTALFFIFTVALAGALSARVLVQRTLRGDRRATRQLVDRVAPIIRARVIRALRRWALGLDPDDLTQEVWTGLLSDGGRDLLSYDPGQGSSFEGFVGMIAERLVYKRLRAATAQKRGGHLRAVPLDDAPLRAASNPHQVAEARDLATRLGLHLEQALPARGVLVFRFVFQDGRSVQETADAMGVAPQVIYNWSARIKRSARDFLSAAQAA